MRVQKACPASPKRSVTTFALFALLALGLAGLAAGCKKTVKMSTPVPGRAPAVGESRRLSSEIATGTVTRHRRTLDALSGPPDTEELWVIARERDQADSDGKDRPGSGALMTRRGEKQVPLPLQHTDVRAVISGPIGSVEVVQQFANPYSSKIEAIYVFPLPHNAAVNEFVMTIGERRIRGIIRERQEAEEIYQEAKSQGYVASLLTEERPNIFTQSVANIEPGKQIDVTIRYLHTLAYIDGWAEFVFPMVVGPRFNPPGGDDGIGAVGRGHAGVSGQGTEVTYLKPGERSGHDISLRLEVDAGLPIEEFECRTHELVRQASSRYQLALALAPSDRIPNRDLVFRYRIAGDRVKAGFLTHRDERGGYFAMTLNPPRALTGLQREPLELVFVLDCSGSMSGRPIQQAKAAIEKALELLAPGDSFQLINFSTHASQLGASPLEANARNSQRALRFLRNLKGEGGTMMIEGIKAALDFPHDPDRLRFVCFLTDGYIGNEAEILGEIHQRLGSSRIFSFGIGAAVNRYLLEHMASLGRGAVAYLGPNDSAAEIMEDFFNRIGHPALTDIRVHWGGMDVSEVYPREIPDLFVGRPVTLAGRFLGGESASVRITGKVAGHRIELVVPRDRCQDDTPHPALPQLWARMKMAELAEEMTYSPRRQLAKQLKQIALEYGLVSPFTAFVAVDATQPTEGSEGTTVRVAVPTPEGVKYKTTVPE